MRRQRSLFIPPPRPRAPRRHLVLHVLGTAFRRMLIALGAMVLFASILGGYLSWTLLKGIEVDTPLPQAFVLHLAVEDSFIEHADMELLPALGAPNYAIREVVDALDAARADKRVKGLVFTLDGGEIGVGHIYELRQAIRRFRDSGRFAYVYANSYGGPGEGAGSYYLASAFDEIWMQPVGVVSLSGIRAEIPFFRGTLDKIGVEPQFFARKEYKTVFESISRTEISGESREMMTSVINDLARQITGDIADDRGLEPAAARALIDQGLFTDKEALDAGLVTKLDDFEALKETVSMRLTGKADDRIMVSMRRYIDGGHAGATAAHDAPLAALVYITGIISSRSESAGAGLYGEDVMAAEDIAGDIRLAAKDEDAAIIVLRINSPGGSPTGSETIRRAVLEAQERGKKVVVSMGDMAASGGYWVAAPADRIFALPVTLTGSIGVAGGKFSLHELWAKIGVNWDAVQAGKNADMWSLNEPFTESGAERVNAMMDAVYNGFVQRVAEGRGLAPAEVEKVARGRVWTGRQARENGLADETGGLDDALDYAAKELGLPGRLQMAVVELPRPESPLEKLVSLMEGQVRAADTIRAAARLRPLLEEMDVLYRPQDYMAYQPVRVVP